MGHGTVWRLSPQEGGLEHLPGRNRKLALTREGASGAGLQRRPAADGGVCRRLGASADKLSKPQKAMSETHTKWDLLKLLVLHF